MAQKSLRNFFGNSRSEKKRYVSDISQDTSWNDVEDSKRPGIKKKIVHSVIKTSTRGATVGSIADNGFGRNFAAMRKKVVEDSDEEGVTVKDSEKVNPMDPINLSSKQCNYLVGFYVLNNIT